jgi:hypothetical protein
MLSVPKPGKDHMLSVPIILFSLLGIVGRLFEKILVTGILSEEIECRLPPGKQFRF